MESKPISKSANIDNAPAIWFRFDGPIVHENRITLRTLGKTIEHLQSAIDRAYLDDKYNDVYKYQKLKQHEYQDVEFIALEPQAGSYILQAVAKVVSSSSRAIIDRLNLALLNAYEKTTDTATDQSISIKDQAIQRANVFRISGESQSYNDFVDSEIVQLTRAYGERSINKEIDQILSLIRQNTNHGSTFELSLYGSKPGPIFEFNLAKAEKFHRAVSERRIGKPLLIEIELRSLDAGKSGTMAHGKAKNLHSGQECNMHIPDPKVFGKLTPHLRRVRRKRLLIIACPMYEYDAWDPKAGDIVVIAFGGIVDD